MEKIVHYSPAGWYLDPSDNSQLRYWQGEYWTIQTAPIPTEKTEESVHVPRFYFSNLFRWRTWQFSIGTAILVGMGMVVLSLNWFMWPAMVGTFFVTFAFWTTQQMACRNCGSRLAVTKLVSGEVCKHCQHPTDEALRKLSGSEG